MKSFVVDSSVGAKWCLPAKGEPMVPQALDLLDSYVHHRVALMVPDLFWPEMGNILWKASCVGRISNTDALAALDYLQALDIPTYSSTDFLPETLRLAQLFGRSVYDSLYVTLAVHSSIDLITADERLANALAAHLPVKWLGAV